MRRRGLGRVRVVLTVIGLVIAAYLTLLHYVGAVPLVCAAGTIVDCETVLNSPSSVVLGLPVALCGLVWFAVALVLALLPAATSANGSHRGSGRPDSPGL